MIFTWRCKAAAHLKVEEGLTKPVVHDGGLSCIVVELLPDELGHEGLDQQAAAKHWQVVSSKQEGNQQNQAAVNLPQSLALQLGVCSDDLRPQEVFGAGEEDPQNEDVNEAGLHCSPERKEVNI